MRVWRTGSVGGSGQTGPEQHHPPNRQTNANKNLTRTFQERNKNLTRHHHHADTVTAPPLHGEWAWACPSIQSVRSSRRKEALFTFYGTVNPPSRRPFPARP